MQAEGLKARLRKRFRSTTMSEHDQPIAANVLDRRFAAECPNQRWVGDTTEFVIGSGANLHLAAIMDLHSRFIVGWLLRNMLTEEYGCKQNAATEAGITQVIELARSRPVLRTRDVADHGIRTSALTRTIRLGSLERVGPGRYRLAKSQRVTEHHGWPRQPFRAPSSACSPHSGFTSRHAASARRLDCRSPGHACAASRRPSGSSSERLAAPVRSRHRGASYRGPDRSHLQRCSHGGRLLPIPEQDRHGRYP